ncbi:MAG: hypothetical protein RBR15_10250 [Sphaerochaeta sp.]|nr:hypothetical protein [Sphaerochaeta sp.]
MHTLKEIKKTCDLFIKAYHSYNDFVLDWVESKATVKKTVHAIVSQAVASDLPKDYWIAQASLYTDAQMLTDAKAIRKIHREVEGFVPDKEREALSFWADNPGFWCYYALVETLGDDFYSIEDLLSGDTHLMHSENMKYMQVDILSKDKHYLSLLLPNGSCLQTIGATKFFSLPVSDLQFYFSLFSPNLDLGSAINRHFLKLIELEAISAMPLFFEQGIEMKQTWQPFKLKRFDIRNLGSNWDAKTVGRQQIFWFKHEQANNESLHTANNLGINSGVLKVSLVRDTISGEMGIFTSTDTSYLLFSRLLNRSYPELALPQEPAVSISLGLSMLLADGDYPLPWKKFIPVIDAMDEYMDANTVIQKMQPEYEDDFMELLGSNRSVEIQDALSLMESSPEEVVAVYTVDPEDEIFELFDWPKPPKQIQDLFDSPLDDSALFEVMDDSNSRALFNTLTNGSYAQAIEDEGLAVFITSLFDDKFPEEISRSLMNAFIWILFHKGRSWVPARSYAIEVLKMQPYPLTDIYYKNDAFLQDFTNFIKRILCTRGICSLAKRPSSEEVKAGTFAIQGTDAFYSLIRVGEYKIF